MAKSLRNRYSKSLFGTNHQGYHSAAVVYSTASDIADFATNGLEGQTGIFLTADDTLKTDALVAGDGFYIAQIRDGELRRSTDLVYGAGTLQITKTPFDAAVTQVSAIGYNGTSGSLNLPTIAVGQEFVASARDTTPANQPFPVMEGRAVVEVLPTTEYQVVLKIVEDLMNTNDYERNADSGFVVAEILSNGSQAANGVLTLAVTQDSKRATYSAAHGLSVGDFVGILGVLYQVEAVPTTTTIDLDRPYAGASATAIATGTTVSTHGTVTYVNATTELGIRLTALTEDTNFVVGVGEDLAAADTSVITAWKQGSGEAWQVSAIEDESIVFDGFTTGNYPFVEDYGKPSKFINPESAVNYDLWFLKYKGTTDSMAFPNEQAHHIGLIVLSAPESGNSPTANYDTVLGTT
jgi:hypothetical protein